MNDEMQIPAKAVIVVSGILRRGRTKATDVLGGSP
jgi:hypothetical protein